MKRYLEGNLWLRLCADLANGSKHMVVTETPRFDNPSRVEVGPAAFDPRAFSGSAFSVTPSLLVVTGKSRQPVSRVAARSVDAWNVFLAKHGLTPETQD